MNIYWYCPPSVMADFKNPLDNPSFRLRCYQIHERLIRDGYNSMIVQDVRDIKSPDIVILMSFGENEYNLAKSVVDSGGSVIHDYCENIRGIPILEATKELCRYIVCCSTWLKNEEAKIYTDKVKVIKDMYEPSPVVKSYLHKNERLKVVWSGMGGNAAYVEYFLKPIIENNGMEYVEISNRSNATYQWGPDWKYQMASCDIAICPQNHWQFPAKSNVKVTTAMSLGLPVIASPLESYQEIISNCLNGFIAHSLEDWDKYLKLIAGFNESTLGGVQSRAFTSLGSYHPEKIYNQWLNLFKTCVNL